MPANKIHCKLFNEYFTLIGEIESEFGSFLDDIIASGISGVRYIALDYFCNDDNNTTYDCLKIEQLQYDYSSLDSSIVNSQMMGVKIKNNRMFFTKI